MTPSVDIRQGDALVLLDMMPSGSVHTCVTSPPYFGLRDYGAAGQIGLEETPEQYTAKLVEVFREVRRVLRDDGTLWLNLGDSYAGSWGAQSREHAGKHAPNVSALSANQVKAAQKRTRTGAADRTPGLKPKDLIGIPWRVAFALQADGWYLRQDIIWNKPNPMPRPDTDRCVTAHEYIFLLSKSRRYYFDHKAIQEPATQSTVKRISQPTLASQKGSERGNGGAKSNGPMKAVISKQDAVGKRGYVGFNERYFSKDSAPMRNKRSVWTVTTKPFKGAHFATFPQDLIEPCILAGCPEGGVVLDPFGGSGTTGLVSRRHRRNAILCELNPEYVQIAEKRLAEAA